MASWALTGWRLTRVTRPSGLTALTTMKPAFAESASRKASVLACLQVRERRPPGWVVMLPLGAVVAAAPGSAGRVAAAGAAGWVAAGAGAAPPPGGIWARAAVMGSVVGRAAAIARAMARVARAWGRAARRA